MDAAELKAAVRRAMLILAAGGDPHRELALGDVAVERLAEELDLPERRAVLAGRPRRTRRRRTGASGGDGDADGAARRPRARLAHLRTRAARRRARGRRLVTARTLNDRAEPRRAEEHVHLDPRRPPQGQASAQPARPQPPSALFAGRCAVLPQPGLLRADRRPGRARRRRDRRARPPRLVDPDPARPAVHGDRQLAVVPRRRPGGASRRDRRREGPPARRHRRTRRRRRRSRVARHHRRARRLEPERCRHGTAAAVRAPLRRRPADARRRHPPLGSALAVRAGRRRDATDRRADRLSRGACVELSRVQVDGSTVPHLPAGRARRGVPRPARRGQPERARHEAVRVGEAGADRRPVGGRGHLRLHPQPRLPARTPARRLAGADRRPARVRAGQDAADAAADHRRADPARRGEGDPRRDGARAGERAQRRHLRRGRGDESAHGRHLRARQLSDVQPGGCGERPDLPQRALPLDEPEPAAAEPRHTGPLSDRLDLQADRRRGGADAGTDHSGDQSAVQRLVHARQLHLPQRRGRRLLVHAADDRARGVVRHVVLPARQSLLSARAGRPRPRHADVGAHARARPADRHRPDRRDGRRRADAELAEAHAAHPVVRGPDDQPRHRPGLPRRDPAAAGGRVLRARERRHRRAAARRRRGDRRAVGEAADVQAGPAPAHDRPRDHPAGAVRRRELPHRHVGVGLLRLPRSRRGQDGHRAGADRERPLLVRVVGAGDESEGGRRRADRPRRLRRGGGGAGREGDLSGVLPDRSARSRIEPRCVASKARRPS